MKIFNVLCAAALSFSLSLFLFVIPDVMFAQNCGELSFGTIQVEDDGSYSVDVIFEGVSPFELLNLSVLFLSNQGVSPSLLSIDTPAGITAAINLEDADPQVIFGGNSDMLPNDILGTIYFTAPFPGCISGISFSMPRDFFFSNAIAGCGPSDIPTTNIDQEWCPPMRQISGLVETAEEGNALTGVEVKVEYGAPQVLTGLTANSGYHYIDIPTSQVTVTANMEDGNIMCGLSAHDIVAIINHLLGNKKLTEAWEYIAADVNQDNQITTLDIINLQRAILYGVTEGFGVPKNWDIIPTDVYFNFPNVVSDVPVDYSLHHSVSPGASDVVGLGFVAVKTGDVNGNNCTDPDEFGPVGNIGDLQLTVEDKFFAVQEEAYVPVYANNFVGQYIFSLQMDVDPLLFEIFDVLPGLLENLDESTYKIDDNNASTVNFIWFAQDLEGKSINENEPLFYLGLRAPQGATGLNGNLDIDNKSFSKDNSKSGGLRSFNLIFEAPVAALAMRVSPNPFTDAYQIKIDLPTTQQLELRLVDMNGRVLQQQQHNLEAGLHTLEQNDLVQLPAGAYYQQLITADEVIIVPLIKK